MVEYVVNSPSEVAIVMSVYRLALGAALPFFIEAWSDAVGDGWQPFSLSSLHFAGLERQDASSFYDKRNRLDRGRGNNMS